MKIKISAIERMLLFSISFTMLLLLARIFYTKELTYGFYIWNIFLGMIPLVFSRQLTGQSRFGLKAALLIAGWLLFFPNAPYIITDIFHYKVRSPMPAWFDLILVTSAAWNGLLLGIISLMQVEQFLSFHLRKRWVTSLLLFSCLLCGYGIYIGRYLRFNSWDVIAKPGYLFFTSSHHFLQPHKNIMAWAFSLLFGTMFGLVYFALKALKAQPRE